MRRVAKFCTMLRPVIQFVARIELTESSTSRPMLSTSVGISGRLGLPRVECFGRSAFGYDWLIESLRKGVRPFTKMASRGASQCEAEHRIGRIEGIRRGCAEVVSAIGIVPIFLYLFRRDE